MFDNQIITYYYLAVFPSDFDTLGVRIYALYGVFACYVK